MHTDIDKQVVARFYTAMDTLRNEGIIKGFQPFCEAYGIDKRNFYTQRKKPEIQLMHFDWILPLVTEYGISSLWLMTGLGKMFLPFFDPKAQQQPEGQNEA